MIDKSEVREIYREIHREIVIVIVILRESDREVREAGWIVRVIVILPVTILLVIITMVMIIMMIIMIYRDSARREECTKVD